MNAKNYAQSMFFKFSQLSNDDATVFKNCEICLEYIIYESDSRFIDFWNDVKIELELLKNK